MREGVKQKESERERERQRLCVCASSSVCLCERACVHVRFVYVHCVSLVAVAAWFGRYLTNRRKELSPVDGHAPNVVPGVVALADRDDNLAREERGYGTPGPGEQS